MAFRAAMQLLGCSRWKPSDVCFVKDDASARLHQVDLDLRSMELGVLCVGDVMGGTPLWTSHLVASLSSRRSSREGYSDDSDLPTTVQYSIRGAYNPAEKRTKWIVFVSDWGYVPKLYDLSVLESLRMENVARSERSRALILDAAFAVLAREGPGKLTIEAIAQEGGISKGRVMHQFRTKAAVIEALLAQQIERGREFEARYHAGPGAYSLEPDLSEQILALQESTRHSQSFALAVLGAVSENPDLLADVRKDAAQKIGRIREEADDADLAVLRWLAARGIVLGRMLGMCSLTQADQDRLFDRLLDASAWQSGTRASKSGVKKTPASRKKAAEH